MAVTPRFGLTKLDIGQETPEAKLNVNLARLSMLTSRFVLKHAETVPTYAVQYGSYLIKNSPTGGAVGHNYQFCTWFGSEYHWTPSLQSVPFIFWNDNAADTSNGDRLTFWRQALGTEDFAIFSSEAIPSLTSTSMSDPPSQNEINVIKSNLNTMIAALKNVGVIN